MPFLFQIRADGTVIERREIGDKPIIVGRGHCADVRIDDGRLSRAHFAVVREGDAFVVRDLNSTNGTWVRGQRVSTLFLKPNDHICAGRTRFLFEEGLTTAMEALEWSRAGDTEVMARAESDSPGGRMMITASRAQTSAPHLPRLPECFRDCSRG